MTTTAVDPVVGDRYLTDWGSFIGQRDAVELIQFSIAAAKQMGCSMEHVLITSGTPGVGKTTLGLLIAQSMGTRARIISGQVKYRDARLLLADCEDGDVIVWDEVHEAVAGGKRNIEWALHLLHDGVLVGPRGPEVMPRVTFCMCTTDAGLLPKTFRDRTMLVELSPYSLDEATHIARRMAREVLPEGLPEPSWGNCEDVARAASHNPRLMRTIFLQVRNHMLATDGATWRDLDDGYDLSWPLQKLGLTEDGLTKTDRRYLTCLLETFGNDPAGESRLKEALQEPGGLRDSEYRLMEKGLIIFTKQGRALTTDGIRRAKSLRRLDAGLVPVQTDQRALVAEA